MVRIDARKEGPEDQEINERTMMMANHTGGPHKASNTPSLPESLITLESLLNTHN